jgi:hypothetical protein
VRYRAAEYLFEAAALTFAMLFWRWARLIGRPRSRSGCRSMKCAELVGGRSALNAVALVEREAPVPTSSSNQPYRKVKTQTL